MQAAEHFHPYIRKVEKALLETPFFQEDASPLLSACRYSLEEGKRFRPAIVLAVAEALGQKELPLPAALAIEYFHTASLIADDLPCMDNDAMRRGKPSTHKMFGESVALLASYALIAAGYEALAENCRRKEGMSSLVFHHAARLTGIQGATGGQYLDLFPLKKNEEEYLETATKKTVSLFELAMIFGWVFGGGDLAQIPLVQKASSHFGLAFQLADDFDDVKQDETNRSPLNALSLFGQAQARDLFEREAAGYVECLERLKINTPTLSSLASFLVT